MYVILGSAQDPCATQVSSILRAHGHDTRIIEGLLAEPHRFSWRFAGGSRGPGSSRIGVSGEWEAGSSEIEGVLVRDIGWSASKDWNEGDAQYMSAEVQAALLGWLWSLPGRVVNRAPAWLFYRPRPPFVEWVRLLNSAGVARLKWSSATTLGGSANGDPATSPDRYCRPSPASLNFNFKLTRSGKASCASRNMRLCRCVRHMEKPGWRASWAIPFCGMFQFQERCVPWKRRCAGLQVSLSLILCRSSWRKCLTPIKAARLNPQW